MFNNDVDWVRVRIGGYTSHLTKNCTQCASLKMRRFRSLLQSVSHNQRSGRFDATLPLRKNVVLEGNIASGKTECLEYLSRNTNIQATISAQFLASQHVFYLFRRLSSPLRSGGMCAVTIPWYRYTLLSIVRVKLARSYIKNMYTYIVNSLWVIDQVQYWSRFASTLIKSLMIFDSHYFCILVTL